MTVVFKGTRAVIQIVSNLDETVLETCIAEHWVVPDWHDNEPQFDEIDVARLKLIVSLRGAFDLDDDALGVVLSLHDQLSGARQQLSAMANAVAKLDNASRAAVVKACRDALSD
jgi:chaperone modulatory protein CbpM